VRLSGDVVAFKPDEDEIVVRQGSDRLVADCDAQAAKGVEKWLAACRGSDRISS